MNQLKIRTEYSFRVAFGRLKFIIKKLKEFNVTSACICDRNSTWGHVAWQKECLKNDIKPVFGVELFVIENARIKEKQPGVFMSFVAKNYNGLKELYSLVTTSTENFYYTQRIDYSDINRLSENIIVLLGDNPDYKKIESYSNCYQEISQATEKNIIKKSNQLKIPQALCCDNFYISSYDFYAYEIAMGRWREKRTIPMHIMDQNELRHYVDVTDEMLENTQNILDQCDVTLPKAQIVKYASEKTIKDICKERSKTKGIDLDDEIYKERFERELNLIKEKGFEDYFYVIWDLVKFAKTKMLVGPGRGSSCGSIVCYLLDITDIDPIKHGLLFERFIDINRNDLPDIDIDFPDTKRELVFKYLTNKYGDKNVCRLGSVNKFMARMAVGITAKELDIPPWDIKDFKESLIQRNEGDSNFDACINDSFELEIGKKIIDKYPVLKIAGEIEAHASHAGQHAAGVLVAENPISDYCSIDMQTKSAQIDKRDAEILDVLKIDVLGLVTLTIIEDCLSQIGWSYEDILKIDINDKNVFNLIKEKKYAGIFQFEGLALKGICDQMNVDCFEDICAITALARPGPLNSGGTQSYIKRKNGIETVYYAHEEMKKILSETYGTLVYQEQVMFCVRNVAGFSWSDTAKIRKAIAKSMGGEVIDGFRQQFIDGALKLHNIDKDISEKIFDDMVAFGKYGFNKSHAVAYGLVSYWCMYLKYYHTLEWAVACLRHPGGSKEVAEDRCIKLLRELDNEGIKYKPFDPDISVEDWSYNDGVVIGGLTNIKGVGKKVAADIVRRKKENEELTPRQKKLLKEGKTPYDILYEGKEIFGDILKCPHNYNIASHIFMLDELKDEDEGEFLVMAKIITKSIRDENEPVNIEKRKTRAKEYGEDIGDGMIKGQTLYLNIRIEDDSGKTFYARIGRNDYKKIGTQIVDKHKDGDWFLWKGNKIQGINMIFVSRYKFLGNKNVGCIIKQS